MVPKNWRIWSQNHLHKRPWQCCCWRSLTPQSVYPSNKKWFDNIQSIICGGLYLIGAFQNGPYWSKKDASIILNSETYQKKGDIVHNKGNASMLKTQSFRGSGSHKIELAFPNGKIYIPKLLRKNMIDSSHT